MHGAKNSMNGLVLVGGQSRRMGRDKASLNYQGLPHYQYCYELLAGVCDQVFLSVRDDQADRYKEKFQTIIDNPEFGSNGPLSGILSGMSFDQDADWLVVACDLPNLKLEMINYLIAAQEDKRVSVFKSQSDELPEPLCAIYRQEIFPIIKKYFKDKVFCPRKILIKEEIKLINNPFEGSLDNVNHLEEYESFKQGKER